MGIKASLSIPFAKYIAKGIQKWKNNPLETQEAVLQHLLKVGRKTVFGQDHDFDDIKNYEDFKSKVPVRDYEGLKTYITRIKNGEQNILWEGSPLYFAKTSGTTSGAKYIPLTKASMKDQIAAARNALLNYIAETGNNQFVNGKMIFLQGSPEVDKSEKVPTGRLSGIVAHFIPDYLQKNRMPSYKTNCIEDWETKVDAIVEETLPENMSLISGIPSWVQMYFEKLMQQTGKNIKDIFPEFSLFVYGGVNYEPYRNKFEEMIGKKIDAIELYPASEGFIAFQDSQIEKGLLLLLDYGIFYEFIPTDEFYNENPTRISLKDVKLGVNYVIILNTNAGLWAYNIGDTIAFVSTEPYRIVVTGRIKHFTSAFGEHVIGREVEEALRIATDGKNIQIAEFTVAPQVNPTSGLPYHEWFIQFAQEPEDIEAFAMEIDKALQEQNSYYKDLLSGNILKTLVVRKVEENGFNNYMKGIGKLGGQNKVARLSNDRKIADGLANYLVDH